MSKPKMVKVRNTHSKPIAGIAPGEVGKVAEGVAAFNAFLLERVKGK